MYDWEGICCRHGKEWERKEEKKKKNGKGNWELGNWDIYDVKSRLMQARDDLTNSRGPRKT